MINSPGEIDLDEDGIIDESIVDDEELIDIGESTLSYFGAEEVLNSG